MKLNKITLVITAIILLSAACQSKTDQPQVLTVMTHDSFAISESVVSYFESENNVEVQFLEVGDTGTAVNKAALSKGNPLADVFYGVDNTFLSRALEEGIFEAYQSPLLEKIDPVFQLDTTNRALPVDFGDVCLNYQKSYFEEHELAPPTSLEDLIRPAYKDLLTVQNPATSSPGLAFLITTVGYFGEEGYLEYWESLMENGVEIVNDWETAYYSAFSQAGGSDPIVVSYGSSPPFEVLFAEEPLDEPPTAAVTSPGTCFRQIEFVGILKGTEKRDLAEKWVDYMLSPAFQEDIPLNMYVFPVNSQAELEVTFQKYLEVPEITADVTPAMIAEGRERWINDWTKTVLR
ncbi:MAG TPA: thiamine ABC transporter substrate-binding protein [Chloroflexi bacterium]|nr:MAG: thiamine ABC transporter substrate-binding protein [Chloroflexota bacterium]HDD55771.1 thiamine ABC transporter substrate-binding protein [Chloroflexota bacterium]